MKKYVIWSQGSAPEATKDGEVAQLRKVSETWLVLEYCSKGSLQDALDRSALLHQPSIILLHACASCGHLLLLGE